MALRKALGWAGAQTVVRMALGLFSAKISAIYLGPAGTALIGQLNSFIQLTSGAIGNGADTAVVNLTAREREAGSDLSKLWSTALRLTLALAAMLALMTGLAATPLASWLLTDGMYWPVIVAAGLVSLLAVADKVILGALNGIKQVSLIARATIVSSVIEVCVFASLVYHFGLWGGLMGVGAIHAVKLTITCIAALGSGRITLRSFLGVFDSGTAREIVRFYPMLLVAAVVPSLAEILVRDAVIGAQGLEQAGYLQAAWRLSNMYAGVMTTALGLYFMAHYADLPSEAERAAMLRHTVLQLLGLTVLASSAIYVLREVIIRLVLTPKFLPMGDLLPLHLLGDVFKMMGYPLQMALVTQQRAAWYIGLTVGGPTIFVTLTHAWLPVYVTQAAPAAYAASHLFAFLLLAVAQRNNLFSRRVA